MAKNNQKKHIQLLSPENYIRQKSRNLPIYLCRINSDWEFTRLASILVARSHSNGNISFSFYLVDLGCLGVKDSMYYFNMPIGEFNDYIDEFEEKLPCETIPYELAHNIIFAGLEFAEEYGFKPCKEFTTVTKYMLEEDTDDIELIEIEVGDDEQPLYINNGYENPAKANLIVNQLKKTAGEGNYTYIDNVNYYDEELDDEMWDDEDDLSNVSLEDLKTEFIQFLSKGMNKLSKAETLRMIQVTDEIYNQLCDEDEIIDHLDSWLNEVDWELDENLNHEVLGVSKNFVITNKLYSTIIDVLKQIDEKPKKADKGIDELEKLIGNTHFIAYLRLEVIKQLSPTELSGKLMDYSKKFPTSSLLKLMVNLENYFFSDELVKTVPSAEIIFEDRESVTEFEMFRLWSDRLLMLGKSKNLAMLEAFSCFLEQVDIEEEKIEFLKLSTNIIRIKTLEEYLKNS
ncbi:MAG: hypothetical protein PHS59_14300 [Paludibacter sp.]|nr:hypothetical protein [Paludibacter sp.]